MVDNSSQSVQIFLQVTGASEDDGVFEDTRNSPPGHDLPGFEVRYLAPQGGVALGHRRPVRRVLRAPRERVGI